MKRACRRVLVAAVLAVAGCDSGGDAPPVDQAVAYEIVAEQDKSVDQDNLKRTIRSIAIYADAPTLEERVHTALKSAIDVQERDGVDYVESYLLISPHPALVGTGKYVALARYAPDGMDDSSAQMPLDEGTWDVRATDFTPSELEVRITELWFANRERFERQAAYGLTQVDRPRMQEFIAGELDIPPEEVEMNQWQINKWHPR